MHTAYTVPAKSARNVINAASLRIRPTDLCEIAELDPTHLNNPFGRVLLSQLVSLYETAARLTQDHSFGLHVGEHADFRGFDALENRGQTELTLFLAGWWPIQARRWLEWDSSAVRSLCLCFVLTEPDLTILHPRTPDPLAPGNPQPHVTSDLVRKIE